MRSQHAIALAAVLPWAAALSLAGDQAPPKFSSAELQALMRNASGTYDMSKNPRPFIAFLILDQEGNPYPSFWCGGNAGGIVKFAGAADELEETLTLGHSGSFSVRLSHAARKTGMYAMLPAGEWVETLREREFRITFETFGEPKLRDVVQAPEGMQVVLDAACRGKVTIGERSAPFAGAAALTFSQATSTFSLRVTFPFPGGGLGLDGMKGEGIVATVYTAATIGARAKLDEAASVTPADLRVGE